MLCTLQRGKAQPQNNLAPVPVERTGSEEEKGGQTDGGGIRVRVSGTVFPLPWGRRGSIPPTVVTEIFIYFCGPSVQSVSNSPRERSFGLSAPPF